MSSGLGEGENDRTRVQDTHRERRTISVLQYDEWLGPFLALCVQTNPALMTLTLSAASVRFVTRPTPEISSPRRAFPVGGLPSLARGDRKGEYVF